jgi:hypothetical protein
MKVNHKIVDAETGEETIIEVELTAEQIAANEKLAEENAKIEAEAAAKTAQRQALLDKLGITEDEARLLLGGN